MKKLFRTMLCAAVAAAALCVSAFAADAVPAKQGDFYVEVNGQYVTFTDAVPKIKDDRSCLPFVAVFEQLGFAQKDMTWDGQTSTVTATKGDTTISLTIGQKQITLIQAGKTTVIDTDVAPYIEPSLSRTYIPFGLVADTLGYKVGWDAKQGTVIIDDVDAILAANKETYTLMDKYMEYSRTFTEKNQQVKGSYGADVAMDMVTEDGKASTGFKMDGTYQMIMAGSAQMQFSTQMNMDAKVTADGQDAGAALGDMFPMTLNMELRGDLEKGTLYLQSPELASMIGQPGMANAWFKLDMKSMFDSMSAQTGMSYTELMQTVMTAQGKSFSQLLPEMLKSAALTDASATTKDTLAVLNALCADSAFKKSGSDYVSSLDMGGEGKLTMTLYTSGGKVNGYAMTMTVEADGVKAAVNAEVKNSKMTAKLAFGIAMDDLTMQMNMTMDGTYAATNSKPATEPPAGATVVDMVSPIGG